MLGQDYEDQLNMRGFIGGHYPQSIRCSTVGGWIAPRGVGTFSGKYGKIEDIVQSVEVVMADGSIAVGLFSRHETWTRDISVSWESIGLHDRRPCKVVDVWNGEDLGIHTRVFACQVPPHACRVLRLYPQPL